MGILVEGILYGIFSSAIILGVYWPLLRYLSPRFDVLLPGLRLFDYYASHTLIFGGGLLGVSILLGVVSSAIAIGRYLKV